MTEENQNTPEKKEQPEEQKTPTYVPASPQKRILAWVGVVYMVMITLLFNYQLAHGTTINGITGLMLSPAICGIAANLIYSYHARISRFGIAGLILLLLLCLAALILCLLQGIPMLISQV
jgi:hypothetical protein